MPVNLAPVFDSQSCLAVFLQEKGGCFLELLSCLHFPVYVNEKAKTRPLRGVDSFLCLF